MGLRALDVSAGGAVIFRGLAVLVTVLAADTPVVPRGFLAGVFSFVDVSHGIRDDFFTGSGEGDRLDAAAERDPAGCEAVFLVSLGTLDGATSSSLMISKSSSLSSSSESAT